MMKIAGRWLTILAKLVIAADVSTSVGQLASSFKISVPNGLADKSIAQFQTWLLPSPIDWQIESSSKITMP